MCCTRNAFSLAKWKSSRSRSTRTDKLKLSHRTNSSTLTANRITSPMSLKSFPLLKLPYRGPTKRYATSFTPKLKRTSTASQWSIWWETWKKNKKRPSRMQRDRQVSKVLHLTQRSITTWAPSRKTCTWWKVSTGWSVGWASSAESFPALKGDSGAATGFKNCQGKTTFRDWWLFISQLRMMSLKSKAHLSQFSKCKSSNDCHSIFSLSESLFLFSNVKFGAYFWRFFAILWFLLFLLFLLLLLQGNPLSFGPLALPRIVLQQKVAFLNGAEIQKKIGFLEVSVKFNLNKASFLVFAKEVRLSFKFLTIFVSGRVVANMNFIEKGEGDSPFVNSSKLVLLSFVVQFEIDYSP